MSNTILLVAMPNSIHTARWVAQLKGLGWDVHLFPSIGGALIHPDMAHVTVHHWFYREYLRPNHNSKPPSDFVARWIDRFRKHIFERFFPSYRAKQLLRVINRVRPGIVHSMEMQAAGYLTLGAKKLADIKFPPWLVTIWGSDLFLFSRLNSHKERIRDVLDNCDYFSCECKRDIEIARSLGFKGDVVSSCTSVTGGFTESDFEVSRKALATSDRKIIMLKGYQHWAGRALFGLRALERCADLLSGYEIIVYSASPDVALAAELLSNKEGLAVRILPQKIPHREILEFHASARISIGLSISDGISVSFLEAMAMGSFPIQSCTACADEWISHGVSGMIVPPEDPDVIEIALRTALMDDDLVNEAAKINLRTVQERLNGDVLKQQAIDMYSKLLQI